ncbi:MAG: hypothetical protein WBB74_10595 [Gaiellaceae bacterium]
MIGRNGPASIPRPEYEPRLELVRRLLLGLACFAVAVPVASARPFLGVLGGQARFQTLTGQYSAVGHVILGWDQGFRWGGRLSTFVAQNRPMPMIGLNGTGRDNREAITPRGLALGSGDQYLFALNRAVFDWGRPIYLRPFGEMNGHWNSVCAYTASGRFKGAAHATRWFRKGFSRVYLLLHGGPAVTINARLQALGLPLIHRDLPFNPYPTLRVIWNPQGFGSPDVPGNRAAAYYPGDRYVDIVGNDLYDIKYRAQWEANDRLYKAHPSKPYAFPEWGLWGIDDPAFIRHMASFVRSHRRVELLSWFNGQRRGSIFDLASKPASRRLYRSLITPLGR